MRNCTEANCGGKSWASSRSKLERHCRGEAGCSQRRRGALTVVTFACETKEHAVVDRSRSPGFASPSFTESNC